MPPRRAALAQPRKSFAAEPEPSSPPPAPAATKKGRPGNGLGVVGSIQEEGRRRSTRFSTGSESSEVEGKRVGRNGKEPSLKAKGKEKASNISTAAAAASKSRKRKPETIVIDDSTDDPDTSIDAPPSPKRSSKRPKPPIANDPDAIAMPPPPVPRPRVGRKANPPPKPPPEPTDSESEPEPPRNGGGFQFTALPAWKTPGKDRAEQASATEDTNSDAVAPSRNPFAEDRPLPKPSTSKLPAKSRLGTAPATASRAKRKAGEVQDVAGKDKKARVPAALARLREVEESEESSSGGTPKAGSSSAHLYGRGNWTVDTEASVILAETPMQNKNRRLRGVGDPTSLGLGGAPSSAGRRVSMERRGGRVSSIGTGFEALPHPSIPTADLSRHISPDLPPAVRARTLISWVSQRTQDSLPAKPSSSAIVNELAAKVITSFVKDICASRVDVGWYIRNDEDQMEEENEVEEKDLPPHPQNVRNEKKMEELEGWEQNMVNEDSARQSLLHRYRSFATLVESSLSALSSQPTPAITSSTCRLNFDAVPLPTSAELSDYAAAVSYGKMIRDAPSPAGWGEAAEDSKSARRKSRGKARASVAPGLDDPVKDGDAVDVAALLGEEWTGIRSDTEALSAYAHELNQTARIAQSYTATQLSRAHSALAELTSSTSATATTVQPGGGVAAAVKGVLTPGTGERAQAGPADARALLRAIAREDGKGRKS